MQRQFMEKSPSLVYGARLELSTSLSASGKLANTPSRVRVGSVVLTTQYMEKSPSLVYGARLELVYGLIPHRGFESLLLRHETP